MSSANYLLLLALIVCLHACGEQADMTPPGYTATEAATDAIQLNQVGYYPDQRIEFTYADTATVMRPDGTDPRPAQTFYITDPAGDSIVREGNVARPHDWTELAGVYAQSFSTEPLPAGDYRIYVPQAGYSHVFRVADQVLREPFIGSVRGLYHQRAGTELLAAHAGEYARPAGHPDRNVRYHPSSGYTDGTRDSPGGWYDAGDYNKYIVNGAFPLGQLLSLYEDTGDPAPDGTLNIPESGNGKSDYLDELKYELDWMLTMQDDDGGLFHKLTTLNFEGMDLMPHQATSQRYIVGKSTTATLDFAAATAQAARVYRDYDTAYADRLLAAARLAWRWGREHPEAYFTNPDDVTTGQYGDDNADDERAWAAAELFTTTGEQEFLNDLQANPPRIRFNAGGSWTGYMANLAAFSLLRYPDRVPREMYDELQGAGRHPSRQSGHDHGRECLPPADHRLRMGQQLRHPQRRHGHRGRPPSRAQTRLPGSHPPQHELPARQQPQRRQLPDRLRRSPRHEYPPPGKQCRWYRGPRTRAPFRRPQRQATGYCLHYLQSRCRPHAELGRSDGQLRQQRDLPQLERPLHLRGRIPGSPLVSRPPPLHFSHSGNTEHQTGFSGTQTTVNTQKPTTPWPTIN